MAISDQGQRRPDAVKPAQLLLNAGGGAQYEGRNDDEYTLNHEQKPEHLSSAVKEAGDSDDGVENADDEGST